MEVTTHFDDQATKSGFVVAYPDGFDQSWNAGSCCADAQSQNIDDVAFIRQLIDRLVNDGHIDPKRVFVTGFGAGAMMAHRLACELSDRIAAIASVAGALVANICKPNRPISVLEIHGTQDGFVPYAGGYSAHFSISFPSTLSVMTHWSSLDGCAASPTVAQSGNTTTSTWGGCRQGATVVLDAVNDIFLWFGCDGCNPGDPNATALVWDFFSHAPPLA
jgi:polyhydroxybutyrate depolymerase